MEVGLKEKMKRMKMRYVIVFFAYVEDYHEHHYWLERDSKEEN